MSKQNPENVNKTTELRTVPIDTIAPYWRNPRKNETGIAKVAESIRLYGYQQPIITDKDLTIIAGHSRYQALKELGWTEVPVLIADMDPKKAKEYRVIDNRTNEYSSWSPDLLLELKEFTSSETLESFFPHIDLTTDFSTFSKSVTEGTLEAAQILIDNAVRGAKVTDPPPNIIEIACPECHHPITLFREDVLKAR